MARTLSLKDQSWLGGYPSDAASFELPSRDGAAGLPRRNSLNAGYFGYNNFLSVGSSLNPYLASSLSRPWNATRLGRLNGLAPGLLRISTSEQWYRLYQAVSEAEPVFQDCSQAYVFGPINILRWGETRSRLRDMYAHVASIFGVRMPDRPNASMIWAIAACCDSSYLKVLAYLSGHEDLFAAAKELSNSAKLLTPAPGAPADLVNTWRASIECQNMFGHMLSSYSGVDVDDGAADLANSGLPLELPHTTLINALTFLQGFGDKRRFTPTYSDFLDYVRSGEWVTAGSARGFKFDCTVESENIEIRGNKLQFFSLSNLEAVASRSWNSTSINASAFLKEELSKVRVAVSADMESYLKMSYISARCGAWLYEIPGMTAEESPAEELARTTWMLGGISQKYIMSYDFAAFDHQPPMSHVVACVDVLTSRISDPPYSDGFYVKNNLRVSHQNCFIHTPTRKYTVSGGIMSGTRWTSAVGNLWNLGIMTCALSALCTYCRPSIEIYVRGDDVWAEASRPDELMAFKLILDGFGVKAGDGKFGIQLARGEFLRQSFGEWGTHMYASRTWALCVERKPWVAPPRPGDRLLRVYDSFERALNRLGRLRDVGLFAELFEVPWDVARSIISHPALGGSANLYSLDLRRMYSITSVINPELKVSFPRDVNSGRYSDLPSYVSVEFALDDLASSVRGSDNHVISAYRERIEGDFSSRRIYRSAPIGKEKLSSALLHALSSFVMLMAGSVIGDFKIESLVPYSCVEGYRHYLRCKQLGIPPSAEFEGSYDVVISYAKRMRWPRRLALCLVLGEGFPSLFAGYSPSVMPLWASFLWKGLSLCRGCNLTWGQFILFELESHGLFRSFLESRNLERASYSI